MPQVPYSGVPEQSPSLETKTPYQSAAPGIQAGQALENIGTQVAKLGDVFEKHATFLQNRVNSATATDLYTNAVMDVGNLDAWISTLEGKARAEALPVYNQKMLEIQEKHRNLAPNVDVQHQFDNDFKRRMAYSIVDESKKAAGALKQYENKSQAARITLAESDAALAAQDDQRFQMAIDEVDKSVEALRDGNKWGPEEAEVFRRQRISKLWDHRLVTLADTDPFRAEKLYKDNRGQIFGDEAYKVEKAINQGKIKVGSRMDADQIWRQTEEPTKLPEGAPRAGAARQSTFWGDPNKPGFEAEHLAEVKLASGKTVTVNKEAAPAFEGFLNDLESRGYKINSLGGYSNRDIRGQPGTKSQHAWGNAIDINPYDNPMLLGRVQTNLPPDVSSIAAKYGLSWGGDWQGARKDAMHFEWIGPGFRQDPTKPDVSEGRLARALELVRPAAERAFPDDAGSRALYEDTLRQRVVSEYSTTAKAVKDQDLDLRNTVAAETLRADKPPAKLEELSPAAMAAFNAMQPAQQYKVVKQLENNSKADVPLTPERFGRFQQAMGQSVTSPSDFLNLDAGALDIPRTLQGQILAKQRSMGQKLEDTTKINSAMRTITPMLNDAGITSSRTDTTKAAAYNQFVGAYNQKLTEWETEHKKFPNEKEQMVIASGLLREVEQNWIFSNHRAFEVPQTFVDKMKPQFIQRYGRDPTPQEMFTIHQRSLAGG